MRSSSKRECSYYILWIITSLSLHLVHNDNNKKIKLELEQQWASSANGRERKYWNNVPEFLKAWKRQAASRAAFLSKSTKHVDEEWWTHFVYSHKCFPSRLVLSSGSEAPLLQHRWYFSLFVFDFFLSQKSNLSVYLSVQRLNETLNSDFIYFFNNLRAKYRSLFGGE